ncbi:MAG: type IV pilus modification PilV family protein [Thermoleophilia bacterium]
MKVSIYCLIIRNSEGLGLRDRRNSLSADSGFTIIETMIALTLMVATILPLALFLQLGLRTTVNASVHMYARQLASSDIDRIKGLTFDAVGLSAATVTFDAATNNQQVKPEAGYTLSGLASTQTVVGDGITYTIKRDVKKVINTSKGNAAATKRVTITVSWNLPTPGGSVQLSTFLGRTDMTTS